MPQTLFNILELKAEDTGPLRHPEPTLSPLIERSPFFPTPSFVILGTGVRQIIYLASIFPATSVTW